MDFTANNFPIAMIIIVILTAIAFVICLFLKERPITPIKT